MAGGLTTLAEDKSIHDFDFKLICEYFSGTERQGPGSPEVTIKALSFKRILRICFLYREKDLTQNNEHPLRHQISNHINSFSL